MGSSYDPPRINDKPVDVKLSSGSGVQLYQQAMSSMNRPSPSYHTTKPTPNSSSVSRLPTAEEEKAALRYYEAKQAVDVHTQHTFGQGSVPNE